MFEVILSTEAERFFANVDKPLAKKLGRCFAILEKDPRRHSNIKRLTGKLAGRLRYRVGDWRVIYRVNVAQKQVHISLIAHRSEVYE